MAETITINLTEANQETITVTLDQNSGTGGAGGITIGTTTITSGTTTRVLYNNAGVVGEYSISGTGSVAMTNSPSFTSPALGAATGTSVTLTGGFVGQSFITNFAGLGAMSYGPAEIRKTGDSNYTIGLVFPTSLGADFTVTLPAATGTLLISGGALGTPASGTLTNCTGLPIAGGGTGGTTVATAHAALGFDGVRVTKKDGTFVCYPPSADTDAARGVAFATAYATAIAGDTIDCSPGNYYIAKATSSINSITGQFAILNGMTIRLNGARLYKKSTDTASSMFVTNAASGINDWSIIGPGILDGSYAANSDTSARGAAAAECGITIHSCRRVRIWGVTIKNMAGTGLQGWTASFPTDEYGAAGAKWATLHVTDCNIDLNNIGTEMYNTNEFWAFTSTTLNNNQTAVDLYTGNPKFTGCEINKNTNYAFRLRGSGGGNYGHGQAIGCAISHNSSFAIHADAGMTNGFIFSGCTFGADSNSTNKIQSLGAGIAIVDCYVETPFYGSAAAAGLNWVKNCFIAGAYTVHTDLNTAAKRAGWIFENNRTLTGRWASDNNQSGNATLTAGTVAVALASITANSHVTLTLKTPGGTLGAGGYKYVLTAGTGFTITAVDLTGALSNLDTSVITWSVSEP